MSAATNIPVSETLLPSLAAQAETVEFRQRISSISRHSLVYFAGTLFSAIAGYFFKIYVARALGAEALGLYALGMSIVAAVGIFNAAGLPTAGARFVAEYSVRRDYDRLGAFLRGGINLLGLGNLLLGALLLLVAPWIAVHFYHTHALTAYSWGFALIMLLGVLNTFLGQCMAGYQAIAQRTLVTHFVGISATIIFSVILIGHHFGLAGYLVAQVASATLVLALMTVAVWQRTPPQARSAGGFGHFEKRVVAFSATAFGIAVVHFVLGQADKVALGYYLNPRQVGIYAVAMALVSFVPIALQSVNQIFSPTIAELHAAGNHVLLQRLYASLTKWILVVTVPLALTVIIFPRAFMTIFGAGFEGGAAVLAVGAVGQLFNCSVGSVGFLLLMSGNQLTLMKIQAANAVLMVILNLLLVPRMGILGAAIASSITVAGTNLWALAMVQRKLKLFPYDRTSLKLIWPTLAAVAVLVAQQHAFTRSSWREAGIALVCAYAAFLGGMFLLGFESEDRMLARLAWQKIRNASRNGEK
jgi:O-antigen/teichoic acid export membrane protein